MKTRKIVSLLLAVMMACSVFAGLSVSAEETTNTYTVVGDEGLAGVNWDKTSADNAMTLQDDGTYVKTFADIPAGVYQLKVVENNDYSNQFGAEEGNTDNIKFEIPEGGATEVKVILHVTGTQTVQLHDNDNWDTILGEYTGATGYVTILVDGAAAQAPTQPAETFHVVAGDSALCNGVNWDPASEANKMTLNGDVYEIAFTNIAAGTYTFKVTTNGGWDNGDWNLTGDAKFGGPNAEVTVTEDQAPATVKVTFKEEEGFARAYINDVEVEVDRSTPTETKPQATVDDENNTSKITYKGGFYSPMEGTDSKRYYFEMPDSWKTFTNATAACYWWEGTDNCEETCKLNPNFNPDTEGGWQYSYQMRPAGVPGKNIFYIDVPSDVTTVIFNNGIDGGAKPAEGETPDPNWGKNFQTINVPTEYYDPGENPLYPDGVPGFNNMVFAVDETNVTVNEYSGATTYGGSWMYMHVDGTINTTAPADEKDVWEVPEVIVPDATSVTLSKTSVAMNVGTTTTLTATVLPMDANRAVTWATSNDKVATVDNGVVKAVGKGTATITATTADGTNLTASATITVKQPVTSVAIKSGSTTVTNKTITLKKGAKKTLTAVCSPSTANVRTVTWASNKTSVAKVTSAGVVTAVKAGTAAVTATAKDGSKKAAKVTIKVTQPVTKVAIKNGKKVVTNKKVSLKKGKSLKLKAVVSPSNASNKKVAWTSSKKKIATVSAAGKVKAKKVGSTVIKATAKDGSKKAAKVTIKVTKK